MFMFRLKKKQIKLNPAQEILVRIAFAQMFLIVVHADVSSEARELNFDLSFHLHIYFLYASSEGFCESAHVRRLA